MVKYIYDIGDIINGVKIIKKGYIQHSQGHNERAYNIQCLQCGFNGGKHYRMGKLIDEYWVREKCLIKGGGCPCCVNRVVVPEINSMHTTDHWMVELGVDEEFAKTHTKAVSEKTKCICPYCKTEKYTSPNNIYKTKSIGCVCSDGFSYPEKFMCNILKQLGFKFQTQYSPEYLCNRRSDFYIPSLRIVIEVDGGIGHKGGKMHGYSTKTLEELVEIDKWKDEQHLKNGVKTIRINCFESNMEYIKENILNSQLVDYFDFNSVDWDIVHKYAWKTNLRKEVCVYWNNKEEWETVTDLGVFLGMSGTTVREYLKVGTNIGWCEYDVEEEIKKNTKNRIKSNIERCSKPVEVFKDNISLGVFDSVSELSRQGEELFGVKLDVSNISNVCNGKRKTHKGYKFKYCNIA